MPEIIQYVAKSPAKVILQILPWRRTNYQQTLKNTGSVGWIIESKRNHCSLWRRSHGCAGRLGPSGRFLICPDGFNLRPRGALNRLKIDFSVLLLAMHSEGSSMRSMLWHTGEISGSFLILRSLDRPDHATILWYKWGEWIDLSILWAEANQKSAHSFIGRMSLLNEILGR